MTRCSLLYVSVNKVDKKKYMHENAIKKNNLEKLARLSNNVRKSRIQQLCSCCYSSFANTCIRRISKNKPYLLWTLVSILRMYELKNFRIHQVPGLALLDQCSTRISAHKEKIQKYLNSAQKSVHPRISAHKFFQKKHFFRKKNPIFS